MNSSLFTNWVFKNLPVTNHALTIGGRPLFATKLMMDDAYWVIINNLLLTDIYVTTVMAQSMSNPRNKILKSTSAEAAVDDRERIDRIAERSDFSPKLKEGHEQYHSTEMFKNSLTRLQNKMASAPSECGEELEVLRGRFNEVLAAIDYLPKGTLQEIVEGVGYLEGMKESGSVLYQGTDAKSILCGMKGVIEDKIEIAREVNITSGSGPTPF